jgi:hypothetical protein
MIPAGSPERMMYETCKGEGKDAVETLEWWRCQEYGIAAENCCEYHVPWMPDMALHRN